MSQDIKAHRGHIENAMFAPGAFVMLHHEGKMGGKPHFDAGRIGRVVESNGSAMLVEFFNDDLVGSSSFCTIPRPHWAPVPDFMVEEYEPRAKKRGWRVNEKGMQMFKKLGWGHTLATEGKA